MSAEQTVALGPEGAPRIPAADDRNKAVIFTLLSIIIGVFSPIIGYLTAGENSWFKQQVTELLNFEITMTIVVFVAVILNATVILAIIGLPLLILAGLANLILLIVGAMKASKGEFYRYPLTLHLLS